jgi:hypothetical protein
MTIPQLLAILIALPPWHGDTEQPEARGVRLHRIAVAIDEAATTLTAGKRPLWRGGEAELEWLLVSQGFWESRFAQHVHEGRCRKHECDHGRSRSVWQLQMGGHLGPETWHKLNSDSWTSTRLAALHAGRALALCKRKCRTTHGAVSMYATGSRCNWSGAKRRLDWMARQRRRWGL